MDITFTVYTHRCHYATVLSFSISVRRFGRRSTRCEQPKPVIDMSKMKAIDGIVALHIIYGKSGPISQPVPEQQNSMRREFD